MILSSTRIAGDLILAHGKNVYSSGRFTTPNPFAVLEGGSPAENNSIIFSKDDAVAGTIKTSGTVFANDSISMQNPSAISSDSLSITAPAVNFGEIKISTRLSTRKATTVAKKSSQTAPSWNPGEKVYISGNSCFIYSPIPRQSGYSAEESLILLPQTGFVTPSSASFSQVTSYYLITDRLFTVN